MMLFEAMQALEKAHDKWRDGYRNNWPQQDALDRAINQALTVYRQKVEAFEQKLGARE